MEQNELSKEQEVKIQATLAMQRMFNTSDGIIALELLSKICNENESTYVDMNPNGSSYKEGQRSIILVIRNMLNKDYNKVKQEKAEL